MVKQYKSDPEKEGFTFEEYLAMEEQAEYRSEYKDGKIIPIESATNRHAKIISNSHFVVQAALRKKQSTCGVYDGSVKVYFDQFDHGVYPDVMVICDPPQLFKEREDVVINPLLIIEVLSPSTSSYDRGDKFMEYRSLPSFKEYVLIAQDKPKVETWHKLEENVWRISHAENLENSVYLNSIDINLPLREIYHLVDFSKTK